MGLMNFLQYIIYGAAGAATVFYAWVVICQKYWKDRGILHERPKFFWGNMFNVFTKRHIAANLEELYTKYQNKAPFVGFFLYLKPMVLVLDLNLIQRILVRDAHQFAERDLYNNPRADILTKNLMQLDSKKWRNLRSKVQPCFRPERLKELMPILLNVAEVYKHALKMRQEEHNIFIINDLVDAWNVDIISNVVFGLKSDTLRYKNTEFKHMSHNYWTLYSHLKAYLLFCFPKQCQYFNINMYDDKATHYFHNIVIKELLEREHNNTEKNDFLQILTEQFRMCTPAVSLNKREVAVQAFSFISLGLDACNSTLNCCLYELALAPGIQEQARKEILTVIKENNNIWSFEGILQLQFLKQILLGK